MTDHDDKIVHSKLIEFETLTRRMRAHYRALQELAPPRRAIVGWLAEHGVESEEIAEYGDMSETQVRQLLYKHYRVRPGRK